MGPLLPGYLCTIDVDMRKEERERERESVDVKNCYYKQQIEDLKKHVDISGVHYIIKFNGIIRNKIKFHLCNFIYIDSSPLQFLHQTYHHSPHLCSSPIRSPTIILTIVVPPLDLPP